MLVVLLKALVGRRLSLQAERLTYLVGFVFLFAFLIWITAFDIARARRRARLGRHGHARHRCGPRDVRPSVDVGGVLVGSAHPVVVQSMTNTDTADADATAIQVARLAHAGSQLVRVTVNTDQAAAAVPEMMRKLRRPRRGRARHRRLPLQRPPAAGRVPGDGPALAKYRINPGNVGAKRHDEHFQTIVRVALENDKPVRIGVNWGSLDQQLLTELMDANAGLARAARRTRRDDRGDDRVGDALRGAGRGRPASATTGSSCRPRSRACATSSTSTGCWPPARTTRSTSG